MNQKLMFGVMVFLVLVGVSLMGGTQQAVAGHGCHGCYGCHGCHGVASCDGCYGCHGCWGHRRQARRAYRCWGCHGCHGRIACHGCHGCSGCYGCHGCSGAPAEAPAEAPVAPSEPTAFKTSVQQNVILTVKVPSEAKVYINGYLTKSVGETRHFVSRGLKSNRSYKFEVRAEITENGEKLVKTEVRELEVGQRVAVRFLFDMDSRIAMSGR